jgi:hypothetical protein
MKLSIFITFAILGLTSAQYGCDITTVICEHNRYRAGKGLKPLGVHAGLLKAALAHSQAMAASRNMDHRVNGESDLMNRVKGQGVVTSAVAENIASGYNDEKKVCKDWYNHDGHYDNIMNPSYNCAGVANVGGYWTVDFAASQCPPVNCNGGGDVDYEEIAPIAQKPSPVKHTYEKPISVKPTFEKHTYEKPTSVKPTFEEHTYEKPTVKPTFEKHTYEKPISVKPTSEFTKPHYDKAPTYGTVAPSADTYPAAPEYPAAKPTNDYVHKKCRHRRGHKRSDGPAASH